MVRAAVLLVSRHSFRCLVNRPFINPDETVIDVICDIRIPAPRPDVITGANVARLLSRLVAQGANIPGTAEAGKALAARGALVLPDFIASAGGVIRAAAEFRHATKAQAFRTIEGNIRADTRSVLDHVKWTNSTPRVAASAA